MKDYIEERVLELAAYVLETQTTVPRGGKTFQNQQVHGTQGSDRAAHGAESDAGERREARAGQ